MLDVMEKFYISDRKEDRLMYMLRIMKTQRHK